MSLVSRASPALVGFRYAERQRAPSAELEQFTTDQERARHTSHLRGRRTDLKAYLFDLLAGVLLLEKLQMKLLLLLLIKLLQMLLQTHRIKKHERPGVQHRPLYTNTANNNNPDVAALLSIVYQS